MINMKNIKNDNDKKGSQQFNFIKIIKKKNVFNNISVFWNNDCLTLNGSA